MKKREYGDRVWEVELASFTPLVFSTTGGMGREGTVFYHRLAIFWPVSRIGRMVPPFLGFAVFLRYPCWDPPLCVAIWGSRSISFRSSFASAEIGLAMSPLDVWNQVLQLQNHFYIFNLLVIGDNFYFCDNHIWFIYPIGLIWSKKKFYRIGPQRIFNCS